MAAENLRYFFENREIIRRLVICRYAIRFTHKVFKKERIAKQQAVLPFIVSANKFH